MKIITLPLSSTGEPLVAKPGEFLNLPIPEEPYTLRIVIFSWAVVSNKGTLYCNLPPSDTEQFDREKFYKYRLESSFSEDIHVDIPVTKGGSFSCYIEYSPLASDPFGAVNHSEITRSNPFYFIVSSGFMLNGKQIALNSIAIQTVVSKWMGPIDAWNDKLQAIADKNYNMIHFTPLQKRGESNSPFSIVDQLGWDSECFPNGESDIKSLVEDMESNYGLLALSDVVLNHTANNTEWLKYHPDAGYSVTTAPHLHPALDLDRQIIEYSKNLASLGLNPDPQSADEMANILAGLREHVIDQIQLWEYYVIDVSLSVEKFNSIWNDSNKLDSIGCADIPGDLDISGIPQVAAFIKEQSGEGFDKFGHERFGRKLNITKLVAILKTLQQQYTVKVDTGYVKNIVNEINVDLYKEFDSEVSAILDQINNRAKYIRLADNGPKLGEINESHPLVETYFTEVKTEPKGDVVYLVNNGWVWNGNPMIDFASDKSRAYLRREVIIWGDCVKLRYGNGPQDSPFIWEHMTKYTQLLAKYFHGLRIDNCHSTPVHVGEYLIDKARLVRPNLYIVAELFTGSEDMDRVFVERLGITSLIREAMQAWDVEELSRLVHKHGGRPIGSFSKQPLLTTGKCQKDSEVYVLRPSPIHALFMDCTHDNESPAQKRTIEDTLPTAALVSMCACATGTTMGYDECYPKALDIVQEDRQYTFGGGICEPKSVFNKLHAYMGKKFEETYLSHKGQYITVHRVSPKTGEGIFLIARNKFYPDVDQCLEDVILDGVKAETILSVSLQVNGEFPADKDNKVHGMPTKIVNLEQPEIVFDGVKTIVKAPKYFPQGSVAIIKTTMTQVDNELDQYVRTGAEKAVSELDLIDLNVVLFRCDQEERDSTGGTIGTYNVPKFGNLVYAGIQGWISPLQGIAHNNDLGHPICDNIRQGTWALDYTLNRLKYHQAQYPKLGAFIEWLESRFQRIAKLPFSLLPRYFALVLFAAYNASRLKALSFMPGSIGKGTVFLQNLALTSLQMIGKVPTASIFPFEVVDSLAAGLPHFSLSYMRCWGRDVFISFTGLLLTTGRFHEAKNHLLAFAATLKHGLIPNLLDSGRNPRYNSRDASWFFLQALQEYTQKVPDGLNILKDTVKRRFPLDDTYVPVEDPKAFSETSTMGEIVYEILSRHAKGIKFREANAGPNLDSQMLDEGFNQSISVDWNSGIIFGGNQYNCGTWMDKMGESEKAGNKGVPGTPRDGAAIEITGLLKSALRWVNELHDKGIFEWDHVITQNDEQISLKDWEDKLQKSFEKCYYIPNLDENDSSYDYDPSIVNRRGIYKDLYKSGKPYEDYQLRPNFAIAMTVAPELFEVKHALSALSTADKAIHGPLGMRTLDPSDYNYRPYYNNSEDSTDFSTSKGRNYHQGPEWLWCSGYFLRAFLLFLVKSEGISKTDALYQVRKRLAGVISEISDSPWAGLPELTNKDGEFCHDSSPTQAWSSATHLDLYHLAANL